MKILFDVLLMTPLILGSTWLCFKDKVLLEVIVFVLLAVFSIVAFLFGLDSLLTMRI